MQDLMQSSKKRFFTYYAPGALLLLLSIDFLLIAVHIVARVTPPPDPDILLLDRAWSIPEIVQYIKELLVALVFLLIYIKGNYKRPIYLSWGMLFIYMMLDDGFEIHERAGAYLAQTAFFNFGSAGEFIDEIIVFAIISAFFGSLVYYFYRRTKEQKAREVSQLLIALLAFFAFFSIFIDAVHSIITNYTRANIDNHFFSELLAFYLDIIEEGGEQIAFSLILATGVGLYYLISILHIRFGEETIKQRLSHSTNPSLIYYEVPDTLTPSLDMVKIEKTSVMARWLVQNDFLFNYRRIQLIKAIEPYVNDDNVLVEYGQGIIIYFPEVSSNQISEMDKKVEQELSAKKLSLMKSDIIYLNENISLTELAKQASSKTAPVGTQNQFSQFNDESQPKDSSLNLGSST